MRPLAHAKTDLDWCKNYHARRICNCYPLALYQTDWCQNHLFRNHGLLYPLAPCQTDWCQNLVSLFLAFYLHGWVRQ